MNRTLTSLLLFACACGDASGPDRGLEPTPRTPSIAGAESPDELGLGANLNPSNTPQVPPAPPTTVSGVCVPGVDADKDGFTEADGDCNDCSEQINPGAYDFPGNGFDEDCSGADALPADVVCDSGLAIDSGSPQDAARAMGLCKFVTEESRQWGVLSASFTRSNGDPVVVDPTIAAGMLPAFGAVTPRQGSALLALSSGTARAADQPGFVSVCDTASMQGGGGGQPPEGYPKDSTSCPPNLFDVLGGGQSGGTAIYDDIGLELRIRVPTNTSGMSFESTFYSAEYPDYICSSFNDFFVVLMDPPPSTVGDGNLVFDSNGDPIGVNNGLLSVCEPGFYGGKDFACSQGTGMLAGTGFTDNDCSLGNLFNLFTGARAQVGASTGWLGTRAPVTRGSVIRLRFTLWDTTDNYLSSTVLIDGFSWDPEAPVVTETIPVVF